MQPVIKFNGGDFGSDDALYALRNYMWDMKEDLKRSRNTYGMWAFLGGVGAPLAFYFQNDIGIVRFFFFLVAETVLITLWMSAWLSLWNTKKNSEILQNELRSRNLG